MSMPSSPRRTRRAALGVFAGLTTAAVTLACVARTTATAPSPLTASPAPARTLTAAEAFWVSLPVDARRQLRDGGVLPDEVLGALRARFLPPALAEIGKRFGLRGSLDASPFRLASQGAREPGLTVVAASAPPYRFTLIELVPFRAKRHGRVGPYVLGAWPAEERQPLPSPAYANPVGFIEVTPENQDTWASEHFQLRDFLTHDQADVWPKYLVLREALLDKLELVHGELQRAQRAGRPAPRLVVMSGFRTPRYNDALGEGSGRSEISRHQYGAAADIVMDVDGDGLMDDLTGDRRVDARDLRVLAQAVERVDAAHRGFVHVDVRGKRARW